MNRLRNIFGGQEPPEDQDNPAAEAAPVQDEGDTLDLGEMDIPGVLAAVGHAVPSTATRRLPNLESALLRPVQRVEFGYGRDIGMVRANNEDSIYASYATQMNVGDRPDVGVFIVADGAGGHEDGERASAIASRIVAEALNAQLLRPMLDETDDSDELDLPPIAEVLAEAIRIADERIRARVPDGGTTLTAAVLIGDLAHIAHVGDSRAYLFTPEADGEEERLEQLTRDHSVAKRLEEIGHITREEANHHPEASRLWKIMGLTDNLEPDISTRRLPPGSQFVLCSDGLWNMVPDEELIAVLSTSTTPQEAADILVAAANAHGGSDNISVVVLRMPRAS